MRLTPVPVEVSERGQRASDRANALWGATPETVGVMLAGTAAAESYLTLVEAGRQSSLSELDNEALALRVAIFNGCRYCMVGHAGRALILGASAEQINGWQQGVADTAERQALLVLTDDVLQRRGSASDSVLDRARQAGLTETDMVDVVVAVVENTLGNYINNLAQTPPEAGLLALCNRRGVHLDLPL